jgi:hypothetical protein
MADTLRLGAGMSLRLWRGTDLILNCERVVAKPAGQPDSQTVRFVVRQLWQEPLGLARRRLRGRRPAAVRRSSAQSP